MNALTRRRNLLGGTLLATGGALGLWLAGATGTAQAADKPTRFRTTTWEELVPKNWDPTKLFRGRNLDRIPEGDERELALMQEMREFWDNAPTRAELNGANVRLPGYVVPIEFSGSDIKEFLLVPYFGACIHSPPPPANQIVHVVLKKPKRLLSMEAIWASGTLGTNRQGSQWGMSGYSMEGLQVEPYTAPGR